MESVIRTDLGELRVETDMIDVSSWTPRPDHRWRYTDLAGHEHHWADGWPTLVRVVDTPPHYCAECGDEHDGDSHLECPLCGETINPGMVGPSPYREVIPGRRAYYLNDEPISEARAKEIIAAR